MSPEQFFQNSSRTFSRHNDLGKVVLFAGSGVRPGGETVDVFSYAYLVTMQRKNFTHDKTPFFKTFATMNGRSLAPVSRQTDARHWALDGRFVAVPYAVRRELHLPTEKGLQRGYAPRFDSAELTPISERQLGLPMLPHMPADFGGLVEMLLARRDA